MWEYLYERLFVDYTVVIRASKARSILLHPLPTVHISNQTWFANTLKRKRERHE